MILLDLIRTTRAEGGLGGNLGLFGRKHADDKDCTLSMPVMVVLSNLPPDHEPGRFHIQGLGIYIQLETFSPIFFLRTGTPPLGPAGQPAEGWACPCDAIRHPSRARVNGTIRHALGAPPQKKEPLYLAPEMVGIDYALCRTAIHLHVLTTISSQSYDNFDRIDHSNMAMDGIAIMDRQSHLDWFAQSLPPWHKRNYPPIASVYPTLTTRSVHKRLGFMPDGADLSISAVTVL